MKIISKITGIKANPECRDNMVVNLVHDKDNKYSKNAMKVMLGNKFIGWVKDKPEQYKSSTAEIVCSQGIKTARICSISIEFDVEEPEKIITPKNKYQNEDGSIDGSYVFPPPTLPKIPLKYEMMVEGKNQLLKPEILTHPNIPKSLHGINPRTIKGSGWWNKTRQEVYKKHDYHCIACGVHKSKAKKHQWLEAHEFYDIDSKKGIVKVKDIVPLCHYCHNFIHSGRLEAIMGKLKSEKEVIEILEHGFNILNDNKLKCFSGTYELAKSLNVDTMDVLPCKLEDSNIEWEDWKLIFEGEEYKSNFKNIEEWREFYSKK